MNTINNAYQYSSETVKNLYASSQQLASHCISNPKDTAITVGRTATRAVGVIVGGSIGAINEAAGDVIKGALYGSYHSGRLSLGATAVGVLSGMLPNSLELVTNVATGSLVAGAAIGAVTYSFESALNGSKKGAVVGDQVAAATFDKAGELANHVAQQVGESFKSFTTSLSSTTKAIDKLHGLVDQTLAFNKGAYSIPSSLISVVA